MLPLRPRILSRGARARRHESARLFFVTGYLGALTTFSTHALETASAMDAPSQLVMVMIIPANNVVGIALVFLGMWVGRLK